MQRALFKLNNKKISFVSRRQDYVPSFIRFSQNTVPVLCHALLKVKISFGAFSPCFLRTESRIKFLILRGYAWTLSLFVKTAFLHSHWSIFSGMAAFVNS